MSKVVEAATLALEGKILELGYELVEITYAKQYDAMALTIVIDSEKGISLDDCVVVHREVDAILDDADPTEGQPYTLNVSSPGIDRPLKTSKDYEKKLGTEVEIKLFAPINKKKGYDGVLKAYSDVDVTIVTGAGETMTIEKNKISVIRPFIKF